MNTFLHLFLSIFSIILLADSTRAHGNVLAQKSEFETNVRMLRESLEVLKSKAKLLYETYQKTIKEKINTDEHLVSLRRQVADADQFCFNNCTTTTTVSTTSKQTTTKLFTIITTKPTITSTTTRLSTITILIPTSSTPSSTPSSTSSSTPSTPNAHCESQPCKNGQICTPTYSSPGYVCHCLLGFGGGNCAHAQCYREPNNNPNVQGTIISSPGYAGESASYPNLWTCKWNNVHFNAGDHVWLSFMADFGIEKNSDVCPDDGCCDYVSVYDGNKVSDDSLIGRYCGYTAPPPILTVSDSITVQFQSDRSQMAKGFGAFIGRVLANDTCGSTECTNSQFCYQNQSGHFCLSPCDLNPCKHGGICKNNGTSFECSCQQCFTGPRCDVVETKCITDCVHAAGLYGLPKDKPFVSSVYPDGVTKVDVYCDYADNYWWTNLMRRIDNTDFNHTWDDYVKGFGSAAAGSYWVGLDNMNKFTGYPKRVSARFDMTDCDGNSVFAQYNFFQIGDLSTNYSFYDAGYSQDASYPSYANDAISPFDGNPAFDTVGRNFSTFDMDNSYEQSNCAAKFGGGWWWGQCFSFMANFNGKWTANCQNANLNEGLQWNTWKDSSYSMYNVAVKIRPTAF